MHNTTHYGNDTYEPIKIIDHYNLNFSLGNVIKYVLRAGRKDGESKIKDLTKAKDYIEHELELLKQEESILTTYNKNDYINPYSKKKRNKFTKIIKYFIINILRR